MKETPAYSLEIFLKRDDIINVAIKRYKNPSSDTWSVKIFSFSLIEIELKMFG